MGGVEKWQIRWEFLFGESWKRLFPGREFGVGFGFDEVLSEASEEELQFLGRHGWWQGISEVVDMGMVLGGVFAAFFALGDDVVVEGDAILVALENDQFSPSPGKVNAKRKLVAPGGDAMHDSAVMEDFD